MGHFPDSPYVIDNIGGYRKELYLLLSIAEIKEYKSGEIIYAEGEKSRHFYFLEKGKVKVSLLRENGSEKILAVQEGDTFFGESAAFDRYPYFASAMAMEESVIHLIDINDFESLVVKHPEVSRLVITAIIRKLRLLGLQVEDLCFRDSQKRVASILLKFMEELGIYENRGAIIKKRITHEDIANITGLARVTVTKALNQLVELQLISKRRNKITILNAEKLRSFLEYKQ
jgi:CRP/FNR family transcriptional regulator, cyclic AMP receptor protein